MDNVEFSIKKNETLGLIGESGCGKTTTAMSIMKFVKPPGKIIGGSIRFMGEDIVPMTDEQIRQLRGKRDFYCPTGSSKCFKPCNNSRKTDYRDDP